MARVWALLCTRLQLEAWVDHLVFLYLPSPRIKYWKVLLFQLKGSCKDKWSFLRKI